MNREKEMTKIALRALDDKKAMDVKVIDIHEVSVLADYFVIASGSNQNLVQAMVDNVEEMLTKAGYEPKQIEGTRNSSWILMDYGDLIIHVFDEENRLFYDLERIWKWKNFWLNKTVCIRLLIKLRFTVKLLCKLKKEILIRKRFLRILRFVKIISDKKDGSPDAVDENQQLPGILFCLI